MALAIRTTSNLGQARSLLGSLSKLQRQAAVSALNRTAQQVRTEAGRKIREKYPGFKAAAVRRSMRINRAQFRALQVAIESSGKRLPLIDISARQTRKGVSVKIGNTRQTITGAFIAKMPSGHKGVFVRRFRGQKVKRGRLPIDERFTIAISEAFGSKSVAPAMQRKASEVFFPRFQHELERRAAGAAPSLVIRSFVALADGATT